MLRCIKCTILVTCQDKHWKFSFERLIIFWLTKVWLHTFYVTNQVKRRMLRCKNVQFLSLVKVNSENLALKDSSSFVLQRYDCLLFVSLILLNGECIAPKNVLFMSLVMVNSENFHLKDYSSFDSPRYDCVLFLSLFKLNGEDFRCEKTSLFVSQNQLALLESRPSASFLLGLRWNNQ